MITRRSSCLHCSTSYPAGADRFSARLLAAFQLEEHLNVEGFESGTFKTWRFWTIRLISLQVAPREKASLKSHLQGVDELS